MASEREIMRHTGILVLTITAAVALAAIIIGRSTRNAAPAGDEFIDWEDENE